jgi:DNA-binding transcriptional MerR regulator
MPDEPLLRIGAFSQASWLSVKALRSYHEMGLLVPAVVDPQTGYRSYTVAQLTDATVIRRLRELDVPLESIRQVVDGRDPEITRKVLTEHGEILHERLAVLKRAVDGLLSAVESPGLHTPVHLRREPARTVLALDGATGDGAEGFESFLDRVEALLRDTARSSGAVVDGAFGGAYACLDEDGPQDVTAFLPVTSPVLLAPAMRSAGVRVDELPATSVAVFAHAGSYDSLDESYRTLGAWVAANARPADLPVREVYLVSRAATDDPDDLRTEICWPVNPTQ